MRSTSEVQLLITVSLVLTWTERLIGGRNRRQKYMQYIRDSVALRYAPPPLERIRPVFIQEICTNAPVFHKMTPILYVIIELIFHRNVFILFTSPI